MNIPQAVTRVDASALAAVSPASIGIVALIGTAEGGAPLTVDESLADANSPNTVQERYRSGDLRTAGIFCFEPSQDDAVPGGAQKEILVKVNPATQSGASLPDGNGADALDVTSADFGLFTAQINIEVSAGTNIGLKYTVVFESTTEVFDDVGGEAIFDVTYTPGADGYDTALGTINATTFTIAATKAESGLEAERAADIPAPGVLDVVSSNAGDTTQSITVFGLDGVGAVINEVIALNGTTNVQGTTSFTKVLAIRLSASAAGTVTVSDFPISVTLFTVLTTVLTRGLVDLTNAPAAGVVTVAAVADFAADAVILGTDAAGTPVNEVFDLTAALTTPVVGTVSFSTLTTLLLGDVPGGNGVALSLDAVVTNHTQFTTVALVVDRLNAIPGLAATSLVSNFTTFLMVDADYNVAATRPPTNVLSVAGEFFADLFDAITTLTQQSQFVNAARATGGDLPPLATAAPVFLVGGIEGVVTITEWQTAFKLLEKRRYNIVVPLSSDPAIHNLALTALIAKTGRLKSEANGYVGIGKIADGSGETRANIQTQILALNTRHLSAISQEIERFDPITGVSTFFPPYIFAAIAAGMQAGSAIAEPLTRKLVIGNGIRNDASWDVEEDASDLIDRGLMIYEQVDNVGIRCIRSITTHLADDNLAFVEMSSNESLNTFVFEFRTALDQKIGQRGLGNSVGAIKALAIEVANRLVSEDKIVAHRSLQVEQVGDVFPVSIEVALVNPINFIPITVHLTPTVAVAA
ncbi:MAG: hypothetical protein O7G84_01250 [Gammaproteobacteria bacterium]|nr:hypothetical protein [Gammaproteobacteria bacterium]